MSLPALLERPSVGEIAPRFALSSLNGQTVDLAAYRGHANVVVWFSRGFTCPFCRVYTDGVRAGYDALRDAETNGVKYTRAGGRATVAATFSTDGDDAESVRIEVTDTGMGIPPRDLPHAFDKFYRVRTQ